MKDSFWHMNHSFLSSIPRDVVMGILEDDKKNYKKAESELGEELTLLDDALTLFVTSLQGGYRNAQKWEGNVSVKAAVAMANSTLNYLFLARHAALLGYFPEVRDLLRSCHERITRCYLFFADKDEAQKFLSGQEIPQRDVDKKLATILKKNNVYGTLRETYRSESSVVHPNLESLSVRTAGPESKELTERIVKYPLFGGILSYDLGKLVIFTIIQAILKALSVIQVIFVATSGEWDKEYDRILQSYNTFLNQVRESRT